MHDLRGCPSWKHRWTIKEEKVNVNQEFSCLDKEISLNGDQKLEGEVTPSYEEKGHILQIY